MTRKRTLVTVTISVGSLAVALAGSAPANADWLMSGKDTHNTRNSEVAEVSPANAQSLKTKWVFTTAGDVSATPIVQLETNAVYVTDWGGFLYRLNAATGQLVWSHRISDYTQLSASLSRTSPTISGGTLVIGDQASGTVIAINSATGNPLWKTTVDSAPSARITGSPTIYNGMIFVGVSSLQEDVSSFTFRGSVVALNLQTGAVNWQYFTVPPGYTGGPVWSSSPAVDDHRNSVFFTTGNNYTIPASAAACVQSAGGSVSAQLACLDPADQVDAIVAVDLQTGALKWANRLQGADTFIGGCTPPSPGRACPVPLGPDYDFASGPNLFHGGPGEYFDDAHTPGAHDFVGAGQKSGIYWALDPDTGTVIWATRVGPGGSGGGIQWGSAADAEHVYVALANTQNTRFTLANGLSWKGGAWAALDNLTGQFIWQVPVTGTKPGDPTVGAGGSGAVSAANGAMFAGSMSGDMVALDGATGQILFRFASGGSVIDGPAIVGGTVFWGSGYARHGGTGNNKVYCFTLP